MWICTVAQTLYTQVSSLFRLKCKHTQWALRHIHHMACLLDIVYTELNRCCLIIYCTCSFTYHKQWWHDTIIQIIYYGTKMYRILISNLIIVGFHCCKEQRLSRWIVLYSRIFCKLALVKVSNDRIRLGHKMKCLMSLCSFKFIRGGSTPNSASPINGFR